MNPILDRPRARAVTVWRSLARLALFGLLLSLLAGCVAPVAVQQPASVDSAPVLTVHASRT